LAFVLLLALGVYLLWPVIVCAIFPGLVAKGYIAGKISYWIALLLVIGPIGITYKK
jgi:hypothetical protein